MPTYDYECTACKHHWEEYQSITAEPLKKCPNCRKNKAHRQIGTGAGIIFKGSGFYQTDYRSDSYRQAADADSKASSAPSAANSSTDAKPTGTAGDSSGTTSAASGSESQASTPATGSGKAAEGKSAGRGPKK